MRTVTGVVVAKTSYYNEPALKVTCDHETVFWVTIKDWDAEWSKVYREQEDEVDVQFVDSMTLHNLGKGGYFGSEFEFDDIVDLYKDPMFREYS
jgi:hypothetical protein